MSFFKSTKKAIYEAKQQKKSIRNKRIKRIKIVRNIEDIRLKRLIEKQSELHQYRVKGVKIGAVLPLQHERIVLILRLVLLFYFKLLFLLFKGSFIGKKNAKIIENEIAINFLL